MVVGMQHQQQQPHASPATVLEDATTPCVGSPPLNTPSTVDSVNGDVSDGSESSVSAVSADVTSSMAVPAAVNSSLYSNNRAKLREVNPHLVCVLCHGYFVDATSIAECLHSFCRSCIILHLGTESCCPICKVQINKKPHLSLKPDKTLQDIVYKLVPGLFHAEMKRRNQFYQSHPDRDLHLHPEFRGITVDRLVYSPQDSICISLEYYDKSKEKEWETIGSHRVNYNATKLSANKINLDDDDVMPKKYFACPAAVRVMYLKKLIRLKYNLENEHKVELFYRRESLLDEYSLMDIAYIYAWKRNSPMRLYYKINILTTVPDSVDKIVTDTVEHNSSQLSPASEQERAVVRDNTVEDDDKEDQTNVDAVKRPITLESPCTNVSKSKEHAKEDNKPSITRVEETKVAEKRLPSSKPVTIISASAAKSAKSLLSANSPTIITTKGIAKSKLITAVKSSKSKSSSPVLQSKSIHSETKPQTPIKSYLSISSILSDIDKSEISKKPLTKNLRKSFDADSICPNNSETSLVKPNISASSTETPSVKPNTSTNPSETPLVKPKTPTTLTESIPKSFIEMVTVSVKAPANKEPIPASASDPLKPINGELVVNQPVVKTETTPSSGRKTPVSTPIANGGRKTPVSMVASSSSGRKTPVTPASVVITSLNSGRKMSTVVSSTSMVTGRKTPVMTPAPAESPGAKTPVATKNAGLKTQVLAQSSAVKTPVSDQSCGKKSPLPTQSSGLKIPIPVQSPGNKTVSIIASLPSPGIKTPTSASSPNSGAKTLTQTSLSSSDTKVSTSETLPSPDTKNFSAVTLSSSGTKPTLTSVTLPSSGTKLTSTSITVSSSGTRPMSTLITVSSSGTKPTPILASSSSSGTKPTSTLSVVPSSGNITSTVTSVPLPSHSTKPSTPICTSLPSPSKKMPPMTSILVSHANTRTPPTSIAISSSTTNHVKTSIKSTTTTTCMASKPSLTDIPSKVSAVPSITSQPITTTSIKAPIPIAANGFSALKRASTAVTTSMKPTPIFSLAQPVTKPPPTLLPATSKAPVLSSKTNTSGMVSVSTSLAKSLSIPSSTSITVSSRSLPPPLITLTSTSPTSTLVTSKELTASQYIPANTKIPSSLEISFTNGTGLTNGTPKSNHFIGKKPSADDIPKAAVKRAYNDDKKSLGEPEKKMIRQSKESPSASTNGAPTKKIFTPNILPEVSITLNPHPEQNKRISPETSYDVSCFKPSNDAAGSVPPLAPINSPICKNIQNSPIKNLINKKLPSSGVRIVRNSPSMNMMKLKHGLSPREKMNGEPEAKKSCLENSSLQQNGFLQMANGKDKLSSSTESNPSMAKSNDTKTPSPTSGKKEARHQGIPKLIDIKAAPYSKLMAQDVKARVHFLKNTLYVNPSAEPTNAENALDLSSPSSKSPCSDKSDPSPEKKKLIPSVPPHMIPVTMAKSEAKPPTKTSPTLAKIERKPSPIAKLDKSPARKADFRLDNGSSSTPISRSPHSPIFSKTPSPIGPLHFSPPLNQALALNFLQQQQYNRDLVWLMDAYQNGQLPSHPLMHKSVKPSTPTSDASFHIKK